MTSVLGERLSKESKSENPLFVVSIVVLVDGVGVVADAVDFEKLPHSSFPKRSDSLAVAFSLLVCAVVPLI